MSSMSNFDIDERISHNKPNMAVQFRNLRDYMRERLFSEFLIIGIGSTEEKRKTQQLGQGKYMADT